MAYNLEKKRYKSENLESKRGASDDIIQINMNFSRWESSIILNVKPSMYALLLKTSKFNARILLMPNLFFMHKLTWIIL